MTNTVTIDDKNVATIDMTIDSKVAQDMYDRTVRAYSNSINIAGFRKGKAPKNVVEKYVGSDRIQAEMVDRLFPFEFQKVLNENKLNPAYAPRIENINFTRGEDLKLKVSVELKPEVKLAPYKDVEVSFEEFKNPSDAMEKELDLTQRRFSSLETVDRAASDKDTAVIDFEGYIGDEKIQNGAGQNYSLDLAHSNFIPGFAEGIVGHKKGEKFDIEVTFPAEYHDKKLQNAKATFKIKLHEVKERKLPELNDELAKKAGKDTLELLKEDIQKYLDMTAKNQNDRLKSDAIFELVAKGTQIDIQPTMLDREYDAIVQEYRARASQQGTTYEQLVEAQGKDEFEKNLREEALKRVRNSLIVEKIAQEEKLTVEQKDTMEYVNNMAMMYGMPPVQLFEELRKNPASYGAITQQIIANKVNEFLLENNRFIAK